MTSAVRGRGGWPIPDYRRGLRLFDADKGVKNPKNVADVISERPPPGHDDEEERRERRGGREEGEMPSQSLGVKKAAAKSLARLCPPLPRFIRYPFTSGGAFMNCARAGAATSRNLSFGLWRPTLIKCRVRLKTNERTSAEFSTRPPPSSFRRPAERAQDRRRRGGGEEGP